MIPISQLQISLLLFFVGLFLWTIGGMISFVTSYDVHNREVRGLFDPKRPTAKEHVTLREIWDAHFNNLKSKWWCRLGFPMFVLGMLLFAFSDKTS